MHIITYFVTEGDFIRQDITILELPTRCTTTCCGGSAWALFGQRHADAKKAEQCEVTFFRRTSLTAYHDSSKPRKSHEQRPIAPFLGLVLFVHLEKLSEVKRPAGATDASCLAQMLRSRLQNEILQAAAEKRSYPKPLKQQSVQL
ncbi:hypothetical protein quinque_014027 [Culex quinquefasciatus]